LIEGRSEPDAVDRPRTVGGFIHNAVFVNLFKRQLKRYPDHQKKKTEPEKKLRQTIQMIYLLKYFSVLFIAVFAELFDRQDFWRHRYIRPLF
jgi:hypothetical protein